MSIKPPVVTQHLRIRRPAQRVYEAFVDPAITSRFWFSRGSARLDEATQVRWDWECHGVGADVTVKALEPGRRILIEWDDPAVPVEWRFTPQGDDTTHVEIVTSGFAGDADSAVAQALDNMGGFTFVLAGAKVWLEHGIEPRFVEDHVAVEAAA
jgi:uncharacterized protein YndB with AHSA1/START domain